MVAFLILFLIVVIFLAFFIGHNISYVCQFWLFKEYQSVSALILIFGAFAAGIIFSILILIIGKVIKNRPETVVIKEVKPKKETREEKKARKLEEKNKKLKLEEEVKSQKKNTENQVK